MGLSLLDEGCEGLIELSHTQLGLGGIAGLEGLLERSTQDGLQCLGVGSAVDPGVVPLVGILYLCGHFGVSYRGNRPAFCDELKFVDEEQLRSGIKPFLDACSG